MSQLEEFRQAKDEFFKDDPSSPLTHQQKHEFSGLSYFPENPALRLELQVEVFPEQKPVMMQTTTGDVQEHIRYGKVRFTVEEQEVELTVFRDAHGYFLPFVDGLAGKETYGAGRYLEPEESSSGKLVVDFNYAYNPYCAYNSQYSCPITPFENRIKVPIRAGEKNPEGDWVEQ